MAIQRTNATAAPNLEERRNFWLWTYASDAFKEVVSTWDAFMAIRRQLSEPVQKTLTAGLLVTYAKPFLPCHGVGKLPESVIPTALLNAHKALLDLRHKSFAHLDASNYQSSDPNIGNVNQVRLAQTKEHYKIEFITPSPDILIKCKIRALAAMLSDKATYHTDKFIEKYIHKLRLKPGEYRLSLDPIDNTPFVPAPPLPMLKATRS